MSGRVHAEAKAAPKSGFTTVRTGLLAGYRGNPLVSQPPLVQAKLTINQPGDRYEQEADRVADEVMRMPEPQVKRQVDPEEEEETLQTKPLAAQIAPLIQRQIEPEEEEELIQAKQSGPAPHASPALQTQIHALIGGGNPLPESVRNFFEPRFGHDFSQVRVHTDAQAAESARALDARAYTVGQDVVFEAGQYAPNATAGTKLLAHELTHVIQQSPKNQNILPKTNNEGRYVQVGLKKPVGIALAAVEENSTDRSQESESERKLGFCDRFIAEVESLAIGSENEQWRSHDLDRIGRRALEYMDVSQLRLLADELGIPPAQEAITETPTEEVIQRDAAAAATVAGTMWWLTLVDGPIPVGDLVYVGLIAIAAVAVATTASSRAQPLPAPQEIPVPEEVTEPRPPGEVIPIESHPRYQPRFQEPAPEPQVSRPLGPDIFPVPRPEPRRPDPRRRNECFERNPTFVACDGFRDIYEAAAHFLQVQDEEDVDFGALRECHGRTSFVPNVIEACYYGPGENWHCRVEGASTPLSIFGCSCCEEDGTAGRVWRGAHWSRGR